MTEINTREIMVECLTEILERGAYSHLVLQKVLTKYQYLEKRQRAFLTRTVQGTLERKIELDAVLDQFSSTPVKKMKPFIRNLLRGSVYQILYMDGIPDAAVCNEAVKLAVKKGFGPLRGFVNGVLRNISRKKGEISFSDLSVRYSMPGWILDLWSGEHDSRTLERMLEAFLTPAPTFIRVNTRRISPEELQRRLEKKGVKVRPHPTLRGGMWMEDYDHLSGLEEFEEGLFFVQDVSSMTAVEAAGICPGDRVLDVCGAPGGKSMDAALLCGDGEVECRDVSDYKVGLIRENAARCGFSNIRAAKADARIPDEASVGSADVVLADLPCSGLGTIGKKPDIKYRVTPEQIDSLAQLQRQILDVVCAYVKPGGRLLYSTCTISPKENQENVADFLERHPEFTREKMEQILPKAGVCDGFFYAVLCRGQAKETGKSQSDALVGALEKQASDSGKGEER